jgi:hypothetical protein
MRCGKSTAVSLLEIILILDYIGGQRLKLSIDNNVYYCIIIVPVILYAHFSYNPWQLLTPTNKYHEIQKM